MLNSCCRCLAVVVCGLALRYGPQYPNVNTNSDCSTDHSNVTFIKTTKTHCYESIRKCSSSRGEHSPPTNVARGSNPGLNAILCGLSLLLRLSLFFKRFFSGYSDSHHSSKIDISKFQFDQERLTKSHYVDVLPLDRYLFIYFFSDALITVLGNRVDQQCFIILRVRSVNLIQE